MYLSIPETVIEKLDAHRGKLSRPAFIRAILYRELGLEAPDWSRSRNHRRNRTSLHDEEEARIVALHLQGQSMAELARSSGLAYHRVRWILLKTLGRDGIIRGRRGRPRKKRSVACG
jgi:hypothetical protein